MSFRSGHIEATREVKVLRITNEQFIPMRSNGLPNRRRMLKTIPSGVEKEEERELHLVQVLSEKSRLRRSDNSRIPVPEYNQERQVQGRIYEQDYNRQGHTVQEALVQLEYCSAYDADCEDCEWLNARYQKPINLDLFESIIARLENEPDEPAQLIMQIQNDKIMCQFYGDIFRDFVSDVFEYWQAKTTRLGQVLIPKVSTAGPYTTVKDDDDPLTVFRRRGHQMQTRKRGKYNEETYERLLRVRHCLDTPEFLFQALKMREYLKNEGFLSKKRLNKRRYERAAVVLRNNSLDKSSHEYLNLVRSLNEELDSIRKMRTTTSQQEESQVLPPPPQPARTPAPKPRKPTKQSAAGSAARNNVRNGLVKQKKRCARPASVKLSPKKLTNAAAEKSIILTVRRKSPELPDFSFTPKPQCRYQIEPKATSALQELNAQYHPTTLEMADGRLVYLGILRRTLDHYGQIRIERYTGEPGQEIGPNVIVRNRRTSQPECQVAPRTNPPTSIIRAENNGDQSCLYIESAQ